MNDKFVVLMNTLIFLIGKTPPRKEPQWFSKNPQDVTWVSISDMGTCGLYISSSSEQLTKAAIDRYNVKVVPDNTVLLSFKLTVGRIAITNGEMSTNEAIAHFKTNKKEINEYLYCYLKYLTTNYGEYIFNCNSRKFKNNQEYEIYYTYR